ncbi:MAG: ABC transporter ATP-binding protein [Burkholderiales bacterium]
MIEILELKLAIRNTPILHGVRLHMSEGEIYGLLGPNGAGKSTTLSVLTGLRAADSGNVSVMGLDPVRQRKELHGNIGVLAEDSGFYSWMSAQDYLRWMARMYGRELTSDEMARRLEQVGLDAANRQAVGTFSCGMKQRLGLARALLNDPRLLILDEPTNRLDPRGRREIHDVLLALSHERGVGILLCTHLLDDVDRLCSRIGIINRGETLLEGNLAELLAEKTGINRYRLRLDTRSTADTNSLPQGVRLVAREGGWWYLDLAAGVHPNAVWHTLSGSGWDIVEIHKEGGGLEDLYLNITETRVAT